MAKKYLKNSKGIVKAITTNSLQLEKPLLNENYDIEVHNRNMDKLDTTIQGLKGKVDSIDITVQDLGDRIDNVGNIVEELELKAENVSITDTNNVFSSSNVEGALNELFQYANNGKELIAGAIGEPLNAEDTFSAMSTDINGLLSTFKTNMMNNGITVEAGDKFKQLIDKLISDNTNKEEITYLLNAPDYYNEEFYNNLKIESTHVVGYNYPVITLKDNANNGVMSFDMTGSSDSGYIGTNCVLSVFTNNKKIDLTNVTSIKIVAKGTSSNAVTSFGIFSQFVNTGYPGHPDFAKYITIATTDSYIEYTLDTTEVIGEHYIGITVTTTKLSNRRKAYVYVQSIMLTSIGKKDALKDSLASILQEEGVEVTEEDTMASLIIKVEELITQYKNKTQALREELTQIQTSISLLR